MCIVLVGGAAPRTRIDEVVIRTGEATPRNLPRFVLTPRHDDSKSSAEAAVTTSGETPAETSSAPSTTYPAYDRVGGDDGVEQSEKNLHDGRPRTYVVEIVSSCSAFLLLVMGSGLMVKHLIRRGLRSRINLERGARLRQTGPSIELPSESLVRAVSEINDARAENLDTVEAAKEVIRASRACSDFVRSELRATGARDVDNIFAFRRSLRRLDHCTERLATTIELRSASGASAYGANAEPVSEGVPLKLSTVHSGSVRSHPYFLPLPMDPLPKLPSWKTCVALDGGLDLPPSVVSESLESFKTPEVPRAASSGGFVGQCNGYVTTDAGSECSLDSGEPEEGARLRLAQVEEVSPERGEKSKASVSFKKKIDEDIDDDSVNPK